MILYKSACSCFVSMEMQADTVKMLKHGIVLTWERVTVTVFFSLLD